MAYTGTTRKIRWEAEKRGETQVRIREMAGVVRCIEGRRPLNKRRQHGQHEVGKERERVIKWIG